MKSTPSNRDDLYARRLVLVPNPVGCTRCLTLVPGVHGDFLNYLGECDHHKHFEAISQALRAKGLEEIGAGSYRRTFSSKNGRWVYKVPFCDEGFRDNYFESIAWKDRAHLTSSGVHIGHRIARCRLHPSGVLVMERVQAPDRWYRGGARVDPSLATDPAREGISIVDSCQGGIAHDGTFKLYDYTHWVKIVNPIPDHMMAL